MSKAPPLTGKPELSEECWQGVPISRLFNESIRFQSEVDGKPVDGGVRLQEMIGSVTGQIAVDGIYADGGRGIAAIGGCSRGHVGGRS